MSQLRSIQILRALAAVLVVVHHVYPVPLGAAGVDLFFVISGFIMASVAPGQEPLVFLAHRIRRVYPMWWLCLTVALLAQSSIAPGQLVGSFSLLPLFGYTRPILGVGWTLSFEMLFYLAVAVALCIQDVKPIIALFAVLFAGNLFYPSYWGGFFGNPLILEFALGAGAAVLARRVSLGAAALAAGIAALAAANISLPVGWHYETSAALLVRVFCWGLPSALMVYGAASLEAWFRGRIWSPAVALGNASYSIYLTHAVVLGLNIPAPAKLVLIIALALATRRFVEVPLLRACRLPTTRLGTINMTGGQSA